ncbi:MAG TPA: hydroxyisourate hydrolase [Chitinophagaceae bacterium]|nr:hydroxyisourate hydrolase [Chitinophagaceae bacterium]
MSQLTTHVLDTSKGRPAEGISVFLYQQHNDKWTEITIATTNHEGRIPDLLRRDIVMQPAVYKLRFETKEYFDKQGIQSFYPYVEITFIISGSEHYHVPLLLNPFGYSTYRGS